jgi:hypothetical protein
MSLVLYFHCSFRHTRAKLRAFKNGDKLINFSLDKVGERKKWSRLRGGGREDPKCLSDLAVFSFCLRTVNEQKNLVPHPFKLSC